MKEKMSKSGDEPSNVDVEGAAVDGGNTSRETFPPSPKGRTSHPIHQGNF